MKETGFDGPRDELIVSDLVVRPFTVANRACNIRQALTTRARDMVRSMRRDVSNVRDSVVRPSNCETRKQLSKVAHDYCEEHYA